MHNYSNQIEALQATAEANAGEMAEILQKAGDESRSTTADEADRFDQLQKEQDTIEGDLRRLRFLQRSDAASAKPVDDDAGKRLTVGTVSGMQFKPKAKRLEPGIRFARYVRCLGLGYKQSRPPEDICARMYPDDEYLHDVLVKAAVPAANTQTDEWAANLVSEENGMFAEFLEWLRPQTILGRFGTDGIPSLTRVPFRTALLSQTSGGSAYWVGEGKAKPLTRWGYGRTTLEPRKVAALAVATIELLRSSSPAADGLIRTELANAVRERLDIDFIDPGKAEVSNVSPASILNGVSGLPSSGSDADDVRADVRALFASFLAANNAPRNGVWIMGAETALALSLLQNPLGQTEFPGIGMTGGVFLGLPAIVSQYAVRDTEGAIVALVNASDIYFADDGGIEISVSREASIEMDDAPTNASATTPAETTLVSMFQTNSVAFLAERMVNWQRARDTAVAYLTGVTWGEASG